ncbi:MAG: hypothetical protein GY719_12430 [bacterium]|nr:hypothetical protein [bacterium]
MTDNARHHPRIQDLNLVQISRFNEEGFRADLATGRTLDISHGGIRLELYHPLPLRTVVALTLAIEEDLIDVRGKVVYLKEIDDDRCAMGIEFLDMPQESRLLLDRYLEKAEPVDSDPS